MIKLDRFLLGIRQRMLRSTCRFARGLALLRLLLGRSYSEEVLELAMQFVNACGITGDYLEFGVFEGDSFVSAFHYARRYIAYEMAFYAFDSFEGLPEPAGIDASGDPGLVKGELSSGGVEQFRKVISKRGVDLRRVMLIAGWYKDTLNAQLKKTLPLKAAAIVYIDCDFYASTVPVLDFIKGYLQDGTVLIFDDWFLFKGNPNRGEQKAFREWLSENPHIGVSEFRRFGWHGNSFIVHM
jgi:hypothetical protein